MVFHIFRFLFILLKLFSPESILSFKFCVKYSFLSLISYFFSDYSFGYNEFSPLLIISTKFNFLG